MLAADGVDILTSLFSVKKDSSFLICFVWRENLQWGLSTIQLNEKNSLIKFSEMPAKNQMFLCWWN